MTFAVVVHQSSTRDPIMNLEICLLPLPVWASGFSSLIAAWWVLFGAPSPGDEREMGGMRDQRSHEVEADLDGPSIQAVSPRFATGLILLANFGIILTNSGCC